MTAQIVQGTNPTLTFQLPIETAGISSIKMTISDTFNAIKITKTSATYSETYKASFDLTQEETLGLDAGMCYAQLRMKMTSGKVYATPLIPIEVLNLVDTVEI